MHLNLSQLNQKQIQSSMPKWILSKPISLFKNSHFFWNQFSFFDVTKLHFCVTPSNFLSVDSFLLSGSEQLVLFCDMLYCKLEGGAFIVEEQNSI